MGRVHASAKLHLKAWCVIWDILTSAALNRGGSSCGEGQHISRVTSEGAARNVGIYLHPKGPHKVSGYTYICSPEQGR